MPLISDGRQARRPSLVDPVLGASTPKQSEREDRSKGRLDNLELQYTIHVATETSSMYG